MRVISIGFHDVAPEPYLARPIAPGHTTAYTLARRDFLDHLDAIRSRVGCGAVGGVGSLPPGSGRPAVLLTFDDGALSSYTCVADELDRLGWKGHFFVTTNWIGQPGFMNCRQIREIHERGHVIGSHSCSHPERMSSLSWNEMLREWSESCAALGEVIGAPVNVASVPGGYYSPRVGQAAAAAGIEVLFTSEPTASASQVGGCLILGRYAIRGSTPASVSGAIAAGAIWPRWQRSALWFTGGIAKRIAGRRYCSIRQRLLHRLLEQ